MRSTSTRLIVCTALILGGCGGTPAVFKCDVTSGLDCTDAGATVVDAGRDLDAGTTLIVDGGTELKSDGGPLLDGGQTVVDGGTFSGADAGTLMTVDAGAIASNLVVLRSTRFHSASGVSTVPYDFAAQVQPTLKVRDGGTWTPVTGTQSAPGRFEFSNVPAGQRYLTFGGTTVVDPRNPLDFSDEHSGRATVSRSDGGVRLAINAMNLAPWTSTSELQLTSANTDVVTFHFETALATPLMYGDTQGQLQFDYSGYYASYWGTPLSPLISSAEGDETYLTELRGVDSTYSPDAGLFFWRSLERSAVLGGLTLADHGLTTFTTNLAGTTTSGFFAPWNRPSFFSYRDLINPNIAPTSAEETLNLAAMPFTGEVGPYTSAPDLVTVRNRFAPTAQVITPSIPFSNPFPSSWPLVVTVNECFNTSSIVVHDAGIALTGCLGSITSGPNVTSDAVSCLISPPTDIAVDGQQAYYDVSLTSLNPVVTWYPGALGAASSYEVAVFELSESNGTVRKSRVADFFTSAPRLVLPAGVMLSKRVYSIRVRALRGDPDSTAFPFRTAFPSAWADGITGLLRTP